MYKDIEKKLQRPQDVIALYKKHGYPIDPEFNLFSVRRSKEELRQVDIWEDALGCLYMDDQSGHWCMMLFKGTTVPGSGWLLERLGNRNGTWILKPGFYSNAFIRGYHKKYKALRQGPNAAFVGWRDKDKDGQIDIGGKLYYDVRGANYHRASRWAPVKAVGPYSGGCQVVLIWEDYEKIRKKAYDSSLPEFDYALFEQENL